MTHFRKEDIINLDKLPDVCWNQRRLKPFLPQGFLVSRIVRKPATFKKEIPKYGIIFLLGQRPSSKMADLQSYVYVEIKCLSSDVT